MKRFVILLAMLLSLCSCDSVEKLFRSRQDSKVAKVGSYVLYRSDLQRIIPAGVSPEDSIRMAEQYINSWAKGKILLVEADAVLSKEEKSVDAQVAEFRQNLLTYRLEKHFVAERLDTVVTEEEARGYFDEHQKDYISQQSIIKGRVIRISKKSPYYAIIKEHYNTTDTADLGVLEATCFSSAEYYSDFGKSWVPSSALANAMGITVSQCEADLSKSRSYEKDVDEQHFLVFIESRTAPGVVSPFEYNYDNISNIIISRRKQEILSSLEQELFENARVNGTYKIFDNQDD